MSRIQWFMNKIIWFWSGITWDGKFIGTAVRDWVADAYARFVVKVLEGLEQDYAKKLKPLLDSVDLPPEAETALKPILDEMKDPTSQIAGILGGSAGGAAAGGLITSTIGPLLLLLQYKIQRGVEQWRLPLGSIIEAERRGVLLSDEEKGDYKDLGVSLARLNTLTEVSKTLLDTQSLITLRARKEIEPLEYTIRMSTLGYDKEVAEDLYKAFEFYPMPGDLVHWQAREVFEPEMVARYGLMAEYGAIDKEPFYKAHMTDEQIANYWMAHWEHASWIQVSEMLFRGELTEAEVWDWFRLVEIPPFWRQKLINIAYRPYTRVDVRRMHKIGVLDREGVKRAYLDHGYNEERAEKMTEFTILYNQGTATQADRDLTKSDILRMFADGLFSEPEAHAMLIDLDYGDEEAAYLIDLYRGGITTKTRDLTLSQVKSLYLLGLRSKTQVTVFLEKFGYDADEIIALYELWDWEKPASTRIPSRTDFDKFIAGDIIDLGTWSEGYTALGYDMKYQEWYFALLVSKGLEY